MKRLWGLLVLSLLPFFQFFQPGNPHQLASIKELEDNLPPELLKKDAAWFEAWKVSGLSNKSIVPYFHQLDFADDGYRRCGDASAAMVAMFYGVVEDAETYGWLRESFGDTTYSMAHVKALRSLGLRANFVQNANEELLEAEIASGRPVIVGWLSGGSIKGGRRPRCDKYGCGHFSVIVGYQGQNTNDGYWIMHDPSGLPNIVDGGHAANRDGDEVKVPRNLFKQRWEVDGDGTGWAILVDNE